MASHTQAAPRQRLTAEERRAEILAAAETVFADRGYHASSIDEVAKAAGVSKALIYEHFDSKEELRKSLLESVVADVLARLAAAAGTDAPGEVRLRAGVDAFLGFVEERRGAFRMLFRDAADLEVAEVIDMIGRPTTAAVAELIAAEPLVGVEDDPDLERGYQMIAQLLTGAVQSLAMWWHDHSEVPREVLVDEVMNFAWLGLERMRAGERVEQTGDETR